MRHVLPLTMLMMRAHSHRGGRLGFSRRLVLPWAAAAGALIIAAPSAFADTDSVRFDFGQNGTWTVPNRVTEIEVEVAGGGGGGGVEGGGSGALVQAQIEVTGGTTFIVGVGGGGDRGSAQGGGGGASILESGDVLVIAGGGGAGGRSTGRRGGNAGYNSVSGAGETGPSGGGDRGRLGIGGTGTWGGSNGEDYRPQDGLFGSGGQIGRAAVVGGAGGEARDDGFGGGGGAGFGGGAEGGSLRPGGGGGGSIAQGTGVTMRDGASSYYSSAGGAAGVRAFSGNPSTAGGDGWVVIRWVIPEPLPEPDDDPSTTPDAPREPVVLELTMPTGMMCAAPNADASRTWIQLPSADECEDVNSLRSTQPINLLGWATTPDFPVAIAERQIENGWGAYEIFGDAGHITAVFIPAGGWTQASSNTSLFPIWS